MCGFQGYYTEQSWVKFFLQFIVFWLQTLKSQVLINAVYFGGRFLDAQYNPLIILCSPTNVAFAFSEWVRDKVVELFKDCARVDIVTIQSNNSFIFVEKHCYYSFIRQ